MTDIVWSNKTPFRLFMSADIALLIGKKSSRGRPKVTHLGENQFGQVVIWQYQDVDLRLERRAHLQPYQVVGIFPPGIGVKAVKMEDKPNVDMGQNGEPIPGQ